MLYKPTSLSFLTYYSQVNEKCHRNREFFIIAHNYISTQARGYKKSIFDFEEIDYIYITGKFDFIFFIFPVRT